MARVPAKRRRKEGGGAPGPVVGRGRRPVARVAVATGRVGGRADARGHRALVRHTPLPPTRKATGVQVQAPGPPGQDTSQTATGATAAAAAPTGAARHPTVLAPVTSAEALVGPPRTGVPNGPVAISPLTPPLPPVVVRGAATASGRLGLAFVAVITARSGAPVRPVRRRAPPIPTPAPREAASQAPGS